MKTSCISFAFVLGFLSVCYGTDPTRDPLVLDPLIVTARGQETPVSQIPGGVSLLSSSLYEEQLPASLPDVLQWTPGVSKSSDSAWGSSVNIRGLSRDSVVFLIDGARVNTATDINARFGLLHPLEIERVEVLKGPISSQYGSGSIGGVVNAVTRTGRFREREAVSGGWSFSMRDNPEGFDWFGFARYEGPSAYVYGSQSYRDFDSYEDGDGQEMRNSQFSDAQSKVRVGFRLSDEHTLEGQIQYVEGEEIGIPGTGTAPLPGAADVTYPKVRRELYQGLYTFAQDAGALRRSHLNLYFQSIARRARLDNFPPASPVVKIEPEADHETVGGRWHNNLVLGNHELTLGLDVWERDLTSDRTRQFASGATLSDTPLPDATYESSGLFLEDTWFLDALSLSLGARVDAIRVENEATPQWEPREENETSWNAHLGATLELGGNLLAKGLVARGYRAAGLEERYAYLELGGGRVKRGDPDLKPEESLFTEWGLHWVDEGLSGGVSVYYNDLDQLISERVVDEATLVNANFDEAEIYGVEAELRWLITPDWTLYANAAYAEGRDTRSNDPLPGIPPLNGMTGLRYDPDAGFWAAAEYGFAARQDDVPPEVDPVAGRQTVDAKAGYAFGGTGLPQQILLGVDNLFDETYSDYLTTSRGFTFNEPGRSFYLAYQAGW